MCPVGGTKTVSEATVWFDPSLQLAILQVC